MSDKGREITPNRIRGLMGYYRKEYENAPPCMAYNEDGKVCRAPALYVDPIMGGSICFKHEMEGKFSETGDYS